VKRAVITAAATYPQPTQALAWPFGMGALQSEIVWDDGTTRLVNGANRVQAMADFAAANGLESDFRVEVIPGQGHTMGGLLRHSQAALIPP
jgi:hypothetical protein